VCFQIFAPDKSLLSSVWPQSKALLTLAFKTHAATASDAGVVPRAPDSQAGAWRLDGCMNEGRQRPVQTAMAAIRLGYFAADLLLSARQ